MNHAERSEIVQLAARYHETLGQIKTAGQVEAVLRLGRELSTTLPSEQAALFDRLRRPSGRAEPPRT
jgi:hypothetical protein